jgi:hypothetical protein
LRNQDQKYFELLKQKIVAVMQQSYPGINPSIAEWKGQEITDFQEELRIRVNANISEKWFYNHMKSSRSGLPRIDMLNLLSRFSGFLNWDDFVYQNPVIPASEASETGEIDKMRKSHANRYFILVPLGVLFVVFVLAGLFLMLNTREYLFTFVDADTGDTIKNSKTEIVVLLDEESPAHHLAGEDGSFRFKTSQGRIRMVIRSPYYQDDTITRMLKKFSNTEVIMLKPDDYELMIHYFSSMKVDDWRSRRERLDSMISSKAMISQVITVNGMPGLILLNKEEFINKLTVPSGSLQNMEILDSRSENGKIEVLRFRIKEQRK